MLRRRTAALLVLLALLGLLASACGGGGGGGDGKTDGSGNTTAQEVPADAIAVVAGTPVLRADFDRFVAQAERAYAAQGQDFPTAGTPEYEQVKIQFVGLLVQRVEFAIEAKALGVTVTDADVQKRLDELKDQFFQGDESKYQDELKQAGLTEADVKANLEAQVLNEKLFDVVTKDVAIPAADVQAYYDENKDTQFTIPDNREVAHILVATKKEAQDVYQQLQDGADFAKLAKEKSTDTVSAKDGGKLTARKGELVAPFEKVAFALETGEISEPVETQFGWHVIKALTDTTPAKVTAFGDVETQIEEQLLRDDRDTAMSEWVVGIQAKYAGQVSYAVGFEPPAAATTPDTTSTTATTATQP